MRNNGRAALARSRGLRRPGRLSPSSRGGSMPRAAAGARRASPRGAEQTLPDRLWPSVAHFPARTRAARVPARGLVWPRSAGKPRCSRSASVLEPEGGTRGSSARGRPRSDTRWRCPAAGGARPGHLKARPRPLHPFVATRRVGLYWAQGGPGAAVGLLSTRKVLPACLPMNHSCPMAAGLGVLRAHLQLCQPKLSGTEVWFVFRCGCV